MIEFDIFFTTVCSLVITTFSIPSIIKVAREKHLYDFPDELRKIHREGIPTLGGIAIFAGTIISASFFADYTQVSARTGYALTAAFLLFFTGVKDDIIPLSPYKKFIAQIIASVIIVVNCDIRLTSMYGFLGISEIAYPLSIFISLFVMLTIINSFNLIDGINGLAGGIGVIISAIFGCLFFYAGNPNMAILAAALCGALIGFLRFNLIDRAKIFMGDTGSLTIGLIAAIFAIEFIEMNNSLPQMIFKKSFAPLLACSILIIPLMDTFRVFMIRLSQNKSPFSGDRNHLHHQLIDVGFSHLQASAFLYTVNIFIIALTLMLEHLPSPFILLMMITVCLVLNLALSLLKNKHLLKIHEEEKSRNTFLKKEFSGSK